MDNPPIIVIGSGIAGAYAALKMAPHPTRLITPSLADTMGSSHYAQGGIAAAIGKDDSTEAHLNDTIVAGAGLVNRDAAKHIIDRAAHLIADLAALGVHFDRDAKGTYQFSLEAGHSKPRVLHLQGDSSGANLMRVLTHAIRQSPHIRPMEGYQALSLASHRNRCVGVWVVDGHGHISYLPAHAVVLATGGIGALFNRTTNPPQILGQGIGMAARAGAVIMNPEFIQFHPTALKTDHYPTPLVTEALRGAGARLVNDRHEYFMESLHPLGDLAPRDIVARALYNQLSLGRSVYLDARESPGACVTTAFPTVYAACKREGIDPARDLIPVTPAAHYHVGGVMTDMHGQSTLQGLYACGEVACTGLHGANRLASNSLLEGLVLAENSAAHIKATLPTTTLPPISEAQLPALHHVATASPALWSSLRETIETSLGIVRNENALLGGMASIQQILREHPQDIFLMNSCISLLSALSGALYRQESRGCHYREDWPNPNPSYQTDTKLMFHKDRFFTATPAEG